ncbi:MAG TPA: hypothetical protein VGJ16_08875 [Pirellulales bacterium]
MDQVKAILSQLQKHHFWLLSAIAMIAGVVGWFMATRTLSAAYEQNKSQVNGKFSALQGILSTEKPPNGTWGEEIGKLTTKEKEAVRIAWEKVYNEQKQHLEWPPELGDKFLNFVKNNPPETAIPRDLCALYQDRIIKSEFPRLLAIVEARPYNAKTTPAPDPRAKQGEKAAPAARVEEAKLIWDSGSQQEAEKMLSFQTVPSSAEVRQAQEDIWVYKAVLNVIRNMNKDTYVGRVRRIQDISIGQKAAGSYQAGMTGQHIEHLKAAAAAAGEAAAAPATPAPPPPEGDAGGKPLDEGRYLDVDGKVAPPGQAATQQFKRMPVFLKLMMDQREINRFLVECSNSPLLIEVTQVRMNPGHSQGSSSKATAQGGGQPATGRAPGSTPTESESYELPVEIAGIIYIYNPPDRSKLGGGEPAATPGAPTAAAAGGGQ